MKKILFLFVAFALAQAVGAAYIASEKVKASDLMIPIGNTGKSISMQDLSTISVKDFEQMTGKKLSSVDRAMFKAAQKKVRHSIDKDGNVNNKKIEKFYKKHAGDVTA